MMGLSIMGLCMHDGAEHHGAVHDGAEHHGAVHA